MTNSLTLCKNTIDDSTPVICVTGSARRIGAHIIEHMHAQGYRVIIHCFKSVTAAQTLATKLNETRANSAKVVVADLTNTDSLTTLADDINNCYERLDILVHNASRFFQTPLSIHKNTSVFNQQWQELFSSNAKAPYLLTNLLVNELEKTHGTVISIIDIHANDKPFADYSVYTMAKAAHRMMIKSLALELAPAIRVNGIAPGANIWPAEDSDQAIDKQTQSNITATIPLQRIGKPEDIAQAVFFLANASYVTGDIITIDGGRSLTLAGQ